MANYAIAQKVVAVLAACALACPQVALAAPAATSTTENAQSINAQTIKETQQTPATLTTATTTEAQQVPETSTTATTTGAQQTPATLTTAATPRYTAVDTLTQNGVTYSLRTDGIGTPYAVISGMGDTRPQDLIIPESITYEETSYPVTEIAANAQIAGKQTTTFPATLTTINTPGALYAPYAGEVSDFYFLGDCPTAPYGYTLDWSNVITPVKDYYNGIVYYLNSHTASFEEKGRKAFYGWDTFVAPESVQVTSASGTVLTTEEGLQLTTGQTAVVVASNLPESSKYKTFHTALTWASSNEAIALVEASAENSTQATIRVPESAPAGQEARISVYNAVGQRAEFSVSSISNDGQKVALDTCIITPEEIASMPLSALTEPAVSVRKGDVIYTQGTDYSVSYEQVNEGSAASSLASFQDINSAGTYNLVITATSLGQLSGSVRLPFIVAETLSAGPWSYTYDATGAATLLGYQMPPTAAAQDPVVVPGYINGHVVTALAAHTFAGCSATGTLVIPDTMRTIDASALAGESAAEGSIDKEQAAQFSTVRFCGANDRLRIAPVGTLAKDTSGATESAQSSAVLDLPAATHVIAFAGDKDRVSSVLSAETTIDIADAAQNGVQPWTYHTELQTDAQGAVTQVYGVLGSSTDAGAFQGSVDKYTILDVPATLDGVTINVLGARALYGQTRSLESFLISVPASIQIIGNDSLRGLRANVRFAGACPQASSQGAATGAVAATLLFYPSTQVESWQECSWATLEGTYDPAWQMRVKEFSSGGAASWVVAGYTGTPAGDISVPASYCGRPVTGIGAHALPDASGVTRLDLPAFIYEVADQAVVNLGGPVYFASKPPADTLTVTGTEFTWSEEAVSANVNKLYCPMDYDNEWTSSAWAPHYDLASYGSQIGALANYTFEKIKGGDDAEYAVVSWAPKSGIIKHLRIPDKLDNDTVILSDGTEATVSGKVTQIAPKAFEDNYVLETVTIPETVQYIGYRAFFNTQSLRSVKIEGAGLLGIGENAFWRTFDLRSIDLPSSVTTIGEAAFASSVLESITVDEDNAMFTSQDGVLFNKDMTKLVCYPSSREGISYQVPDTVTSIEPWAFGAGDTYSLNVRLRSVVFPDTLANIGDSAFWNHQALEDVNLSHTQAQLGDHVFFSATALKRVVLPEQMTHVPYRTFSFCTSLESVSLPSTLTSINDQAFFYCSIPALTFSEGLQTIGDNAFAYCDKLTSLTLPASMRAIKDHAFYDCDALETVVLGGTQDIGVGAFSGCKVLDNVVIPATVFTLNDSAFSGCAGLYTVTIQDEQDARCQLTEIPEGCFNGDYHLQNITLPETITKIGTLAFHDCNALNKTENPRAYVVFLTKNELEVGEDAFCQGSDGGGGTCALGSTSRSTSGSTSGSVSGSASRSTSGSVAPLAVSDQDSSVYPNAASLARADQAGTVYAAPQDDDDSWWDWFDDLLAGDDDDYDDEDAGSLFAYDFDVYGYSYSETPSVFEEFGNEFFPLDITADQGITVKGEAVVGNAIQLVCDAATQNGDLSYVWYRNGMQVFEGGDIFRVLLNNSSEEFSVAVANSYDPCSVQTFTRTIRSGASLAKATVSSMSDQVYTGGYHTPRPVIALDGTPLVFGRDYTLHYDNNCNVGTATVTITGKGSYAGTYTATFKILPAAQSITAKGLTAKIKAKKVKKKARRIAARKAVRVTGAKNPLVYKKAGGSKKLKVATDGRITVKKGTKRGVYKVKVRVYAKAAGNYRQSNVVTVTAKVRVR